MKKILILFLFVVSIISYHTSAKNSEINFSSDKNTFSESQTVPFPSSTPEQEFQNIESNVGVVDVNKNKIVCLRTKNANLAKNSQIKIIISLFDPPQKSVSAIVEKKLERSCAYGDSEAGEDFENNSYYSLKLDNKKIDDIGIALGIFNSDNSVEIKDGLASIDIDNDGKAEFFRNCTSMEGTHLTIWTGKPLEGKRVWHSYYYLGYDTEPNCKEMDYEETE